MRKILVTISILFVCIFISFAKEINRTFYGLTFHTSYKIVKWHLAYIIHSGFISGYQNRYGDNLKPPTNVYHRMTA